MASSPSGLAGTGLVLPLEESDAKVEPKGRFRVVNPGVTNEEAEAAENEDADNPAALFLIPKVEDCGRGCFGGGGFIVVRCVGRDRPLFASSPAAGVLGKLTRRFVLPPPQRVPAAEADSNGLLPQPPKLEVFPLLKIDDGWCCERGGDGHNRFNGSRRASESAPSGR